MLFKGSQKQPDQKNIKFIQKNDRQILIQSMQDQLLSVFNNYAFHNTTQILLSNLTVQELKQILSAVQTQKQYENLSHMIRVTLFVHVAHRIDRSFYLTHYMDISAQEFSSERCSLVAGRIEAIVIEGMLETYESLKERVQEQFQDDAEAILAAAFQPELALPPVRRSTVAPSCLTVYQIVLACQKINQENCCMDIQDEKYRQKHECFQQLLAFQIKMADIELSAITNQYQHFSELVFRFMVYRNSVLAMHEISPFPSLPEAMKQWKNAMSKHYIKANHTFAEVAGFKINEATSAFGRFTPELLINEGYLNQYVESLVDLSIDENLVAFCGHSKLNLGELYQDFEEYIIQNLMQERYIDIKEQLNKWCNYGLKPCTLLKIIESSSFCDREEAKYNYCLRKDSFIQSCAKIHGFADQPSNIIPCS